MQSLSLLTIVSLFLAVSSAMANQPCTQRDFARVQSVAPTNILHKGRTISVELEIPDWHSVVECNKVFYDWGWYVWASFDRDEVPEAKITYRSNYGASAIRRSIPMKQLQIASPMYVVLREKFPSYIVIHDTEAHLDFELYFNPNGTLGTIKVHEKHL